MLLTKHPVGWVKPAAYTTIFQLRFFSKAGFTRHTIFQMTTKKVKDLFRLRKDS